MRKEFLTEDMHCRQTRGAEPSGWQKEVPGGQSSCSSVDPGCNNTEADSCSGVRDRVQETGHEIRCSLMQPSRALTSALFMPSWHEGVKFSCSAEKIQGVCVSSSTAIPASQLSEQGGDGGPRNKHTSFGRGVAGHPSLAQLPTPTVIQPCARSHFVCVYGRCAAEPQ